MASTSSDIEALKAEIERLRAENTDLYHQMESWRRDAHELDDVVGDLRERIRRLLGHIPAGALPAPTVFGKPRSIPGDDDGGDGAAAAAGGRPPVARSVSSFGPYPSLGPSPSGVWAMPPPRDDDGTIPAITRRDEHGNLQVMLCATPNCNSGLVVEAVRDGRARWVPKKPEDEDNE